MDKRRRGRRRRVHLTICITIAATVLGFIFAQNNGNLGASNQGVDYTNSLPIDAKKPTYNRTASVEFCDDCRLNPQAGGKITSCYDRVIYLRDRYGVLEDDGRANIMQQHGDNCNITRFPVELWSPNNDKNKNGLGKDIGKFDSMFSRLDYTSLNFSTSEIGEIGSASASSKHGNLTIYIYDTIPYDMSIGLEQRMAAVYASESEFALHMQVFAFIHICYCYSSLHTSTSLVQITLMRILRQMLPFYIFSGHILDEPIIQTRQIYSSFHLHMHHSASIRQATSWSVDKCQLKLSRMEY